MNKNWYSFGFPYNLIPRFMCNYLSILLDTTILLPILLHAAVVWSFAAKSHHNTLQIHIYKLLRKI